jgi:diaminopimelate epimerase
MKRGMRVIKMSGAGNDFVLFGPEESRRIAGREADWARVICRRGISIGADGILLVESAGQRRVRVRFHNPDGSAAFCGNGSRCAARFAHDAGLAASPLWLETAVGEVRAEVAGDRVELTLPAPVDAGALDLELEGEVLSGRRVEAGVPHFVAFVPDPRACPLERWAGVAHGHPAFGAAGTNVDLAGWTAVGDLALRTWERGVGRETLACGSGAVAAAFVARLAGAGERVRVLPASGSTLDVTLPGRPAAPEAALLAGDARFILDGWLAAEAVSGLGAR